MLERCGAKQSVKATVRPDGFSFCLGKVHENTPFVPILTQFLVCFRGQANRSTILNSPKHSEKPIASTWFRQFGLLEVPTNQRFFNYNPTIATLPEICCKLRLAFSLRDRSCTVQFARGLLPRMFPKARNCCSQSFLLI